MKITLKQYASLFGLNLAKVKRWSRAFLGSDPAAGIRMGYERKLTLNEAFLLYLGGLFVSKLQVPLKEVPKLLSDLKLWLKAKGMLPDFYPFKSWAVWSNWELEIISGKPYICQGVITFFDVETKVKGLKIWQKRYQIEQITKLKQKKLVNTAFFQVKASFNLDLALYDFLFWTLAKKPLKMDN